MKLKKIITIKLLLVILVLISGCKESNDEQEGKNSKGAKTIFITMIAKSSANPVFLSAKTGAIAQAQKISEKYSKLDVVVNWKTPAIENASEQAAIIRNAIQDGTNAIIVSCSDIDSLTSAIDNAVDSGVPVMTFDSDAPDSKRFAFYGPDDIEMGKTVMNELAKLIGGKGKIAILGGNKEAPNLQERIKGIKIAASDYKGIELVGEFYHPENEIEAIAEMLRVQSQYPDLKGWAMVGGWPMFGKELMNKIEPGKIKIVAVDALPVQLEYIEKNFAQVLLGQPTFKWGEVTMGMVIDKIYLHKKVDELIRLSPIPITLKNLGGWSRQLRAWGYTEIPEKYLIM
jgi:ribose transport system substrate-binding protein